MKCNSFGKVATFAIGLALVGCGGAAPTPLTPPSSPGPSSSAAPDQPASPTGLEQPAALPEEPDDGAAAEPAREPVPAAASLPDGLRSWSDAELEDLDKACKPLMDAVVRRANRDRERRDRTAAALHALQDPPKLAGVDMDRCLGFVRSQLQAYRAKSIESEAVIQIKRIVVGLADATAGPKPRLCPSAPPVPADLDRLQDGPAQVPPSAWNTEGWKCVRFQLGGAPQRFQYELITDPDAGSYRIIARGFPVEGHGPEELFLAGETDDDGRVQPSSRIMRKSSRAALR